VHVDDLLQSLRNDGSGRQLRRRSSGPRNDGRRREDDMKKELRFSSLGRRRSVGEEGREFVVFVGEEGGKVAESCR